MTKTRFGSLYVLLSALALLVLFLGLAGCGGQPEPDAEMTEEAAPPAEEEMEAPPAEEEPQAQAEPEAEQQKLKTRNALMNPSSLKEKAPDVYRAKFETTKGDFVIEVTRSWAPKGADRFYNLVKNGFYDDCKLFRIEPGFVAQFGMHADPAVSQMWQNAWITDDPVTKTNRKGAVTFATAGANTRTTQVFINLSANAGLDAQGFAPFGMVVEGMDVVESFYSGYRSGADQGMIRAKGNEYLEANYPNMDTINEASILDM